MPVVPSAKDGLHCGIAGGHHDLGADRVVPSAKDGLHCGPPPVLPVVVVVVVVPSAKDGLHCGGELRAGGMSVGESSRPPRTGSIAAAR